MVRHKGTPILDIETPCQLLQVQRQSLKNSLKLYFDDAPDKSMITHRINKLDDRSNNLKTSVEVLLGH